ncbi:MAG: ferrochelatase [Gammaproteobacteria bacterium]|jgi:ferrochelatase
MRYIGREAFRHDQPMRIGVLLVNLGTPDQPDTASVRRYLKQFLSDPRVVEVPRALWWLILNGVILRIRPRRSARAYRSVWSEQGSPLMVHTQALGDAVSSALEDATPGVFKLRVAMCYGNPDIAGQIEALFEQGVTRLFVLPLYPQYSATTTAAVFDAVTHQLSRHRWVPDLSFETSYHDDPNYIAAVTQSIRDHWRERGEPQRLLFSFHGIPQRYVLAGDPYFCHCQASARLIAETLGLPQERWQVAFQSRVGREPWLQPYVDETLTQWGRDGVSDVHVVCPGFAVDCLETLEEIAEENRERFLEAGGSTFSYIAALNSGKAHVDTITQRIMRATSHWMDWARTEQQGALDRQCPRSQRAAQLSASSQTAGLSIDKINTRPPE